MLKTSLVVMACFILLAGCQNAPETDTSATTTESAPAAGTSESEAVANLPDRLAHHNFILETVDGQAFTYPTPEGATMEMPSLSFGHWPEVSGKICNQYTGQAELDGDTLFLKNAATTMMACSPEELEKFERLFHQLLTDGVKVSLEGESLTLTGGDHVLVFKLQDHVQ